MLFYIHLLSLTIVIYVIIYIYIYIIYIYNIYIYIYYVFFIIHAITNFIYESVDNKCPCWYSMRQSSAKHVTLCRISIKCHIVIIFVY